MINVDFSGCPVPILQNEWEFGLLYNFYMKLEAKRIIEIGSFYGGTLWYWLWLSHLETICIIDLPITNIDPRFKKMEECRSLWHEWTREVKNTQFIFADSRNSQVVENVSMVFAKEEADMLFIDGGHDYDTVKKDFENYSQFVRKDGLIVFHDTVGEDGVYKLWKEISPARKHIEFYEEFGIGILFGN